MTAHASVRTVDLEQRLSEAEATIAALLSDQIDAVIDPESKTPLLLNRAQQALRESEERSQRYLDSATVILLAMDPDCRVQLVNRYACSVLGWSADELIGRDWFATCVPENVRADVRERFDKLVDDGSSTNEAPVVTKTGESRRIEWHNTILRDEHGVVTGTLSSGIDVTERRRLEARYQQASKMEAVGQLAAGVAHDFNNLLTVIIGYAEIMAADDADAARHTDEVREILSAATSATGLTKQLLAFSRQQVLHSKPLDVNALIVHMHGLLSRLIGVQIEIVKDLSSTLSLAFADRGQLEQVVMNLVVNARDAMPDGGRVTIVTRDVELDDASFQNEAVAPGRYVMLAISDTGTGMGEETHRRLFEPFYTTKESGKGTGLGLSTTYGIVKQSKGYIDVDTKLGSGTTFKVYLPCAVVAGTTP
jgi:two-component system cell cycle sensor histidine kinase/response regulator CckA